MIVLAAAVAAAYEASEVWRAADEARALLATLAERASWTVEASEAGLEVIDDAERDAWEPEDFWAFLGAAWPPSPYSESDAKGWDELGPMWATMGHRELGLDAQVIGWEELGAWVAESASDLRDAGETAGRAATEGGVGLGFGVLLALALSLFRR